MDDVEYGHYTTISGVMGILTSESLWATNIKFLNDEHEFQHALDLIKELLPTSRISREEPNNPVHNSFITTVTEKIDALDTYRCDSVFTLSFTEETDLLSQWRGYCPSNNGYCLVIDTPKLYESLQGHFDSVHFVKCVYDLDQKKEQLRRLLNSAWRKYVGVKSDDAGKKARNAMIEDLSKDLMLLASYFKHPSFAEEKEHRIVVMMGWMPSEGPMHFREGRFSIIPYLQLGAPRSFVKRIVVGPTAHQKLSIRALEAFIEKVYGQPIFVVDVGVDFSKTPYRPW
jgi:Protein of unknown function (DUF2971)